MRWIIFLGIAIFVIALWATYSLGPNFAADASPYGALVPMSSSVPFEGRAAYVDSQAQRAAPHNAGVAAVHVPVSRAR
jgi:hypothetical protein